MTKILFTLVFSVFISNSFAQVATWTNGAGTNLFSTPLNWSTGIVPTTTNDILFDASTAAPCIINQNVSVISITSNASYNGGVNINAGFNVTTTTDFTWNSSATITGNTGNVTIGRNFFMSAGSFTAGTGTIMVMAAYVQNGTTNTVNLSTAGLVTYSTTFTLQNGTYIAPANETHNGNFTVSGGIFTNNNGNVRFVSPSNTVIATSAANAAVITNTQPFHNLIFENSTIAPVNLFRTYAISGIVTVNNELIYDYGATLANPSIITNKSGATGTIVLKKDLRVITGSTRRNYDGGSATIELNSSSTQTLFLNNLNNGYTLCNVSVTGPQRIIQNNSLPFQTFQLNCMNFTCASAGFITMNTSLNLKGDLTDNGNLIFPSSQITYFRGDAKNQNIITSGEISFSTLRIVNGTPYSIIQQGNVAIRDFMAFASGATHNVNGKVLTFKSVAVGANSAKTGMLTDLTLFPTASLIGNFTVERYLKGGTTGWVLLGSPFGSQNTLADWVDDFPMSGFTGATGSTFPAFTSMYSYDETQPGVVGADAKYIAPTNITDPIGTGKGWWAYVGNALNTTADITIDITGALVSGVNRNNVNIPVTATPNNGAIPNADDGWNLIANPYPASLDFKLFRASNSSLGLGASIFAHNSDLGADATYNDATSISSPTVFNGGISQFLTSSRAFNAQVTNSGNLVAQENHKRLSGAGDNMPLWRIATVDSATQYFRLFMQNNTDNRVNDCVINFNDLATTGIDDYDAIRGKTEIDSKNDMLLMTKLNGRDFAINSIPLDTVNITSIPLSTRVGNTGSYTINASNLAGIVPNNYCIKLVDYKLNTTINLRNESYTTILDSIDNESYRFSIVIEPNATTLSITANVTTPTNTTTVQANVNSAGNFNYYLINTTTNTKIDSVMNTNTAQFNNVAVGYTYKIQAVQVGGAICSVAETTVEVVGSVTNIKTNATNPLQSYYANGAIVIKTNATYEPATISVHNMLGQLLTSKKITLNGQTELVALGDIATQNVLVTVVSNTTNYSTKITVIK